MDTSRRNITVKIFISYLILGLLVVTAGYLVFSQIKTFTKTQASDIREKDKILSVGKILTLMYETESSARAALQSNSKAAFDLYSRKNDSLSHTLEALYFITDKPQQKKLVDSVKALLRKKVSNIMAIRRIKTNPLYRTDIKKAIEELSDLESSLGKVSLETHVRNLGKISPDERKNIEEFLSIVNKYSVSDVDEVSSKKILDSVVTASKLTLKEIRQKLDQQQSSLTKKENELLANDLILSQQLRSILSDFEQELLINVSKMNDERDKILKRSISIITIAAIMGVVLAIIFSIMVLNDFWKSQRYRKKLEKASDITASLLKNREQLISTVSHDLRTPLSTIAGHVELLQNATLKEKEAYYVHRIKHASLYVTQLVNDLLEFSKLEAGKIKIEHIPFSLQDSITETAQSIQSLFRSKPIKLTIEIDDPLKQELVGDPFRIRQILTNLLSNAYKFTEKGQIKISATLLESIDDTRKVCIAIADTGIGIKKEKHKLIFKEFTQAGTDVEKKYEGSGLGLTISKKLTQLLSGTLALESEVHKGSTFILKLPLKARKKNKAPVSPSSIQTSEQFPIRLSAIVIDDDPSLLELTSEILKQAGALVHAFKNPAEALHALQHISYNCIITDIQMPEINGFQFLQQLTSAKTKGYKNQPIIAVTGHKDTAEHIFLDAGFSAVIYKPYPREVLLKTIQDFCGLTHFKTVLPEASSRTEKEKDHGYDLSSLKAFLGYDEESIAQVLQTFYTATKADLETLETHITHGNIKALNSLAHKMLAMFRQLYAKKVVVILEDLEQHKLNTGLDEKYRFLKSEIDLVFTALKAQY